MDNSCERNNKPDWFTEDNYIYLKNISDERLAVELDARRILYHAQPEDLQSSSYLSNLWLRIKSTGSCMRRGSSVITKTHFAEPISIGDLQKLSALTHELFGDYDQDDALDQLVNSGLDPCTIHVKINLRSRDDIILSEIQHLLKEYRNTLGLRAQRNIREATSRKKIISDLKKAHKNKSLQSLDLLIYNRHFNKELTQANIIDILKLSRFPPDLIAPSYFKDVHLVHCMKIIEKEFISSLSFPVIKFRNS